MNVRSRVYTVFIQLNRKRSTYPQTVSNSDTIASSISMRVFKYSSNERLSVFWLSVWSRTLCQFRMKCEMLTVLAMFSLYYYLLLLLWFRQGVISSFPMSRATVPELLFPLTVQITDFPIYLAVQRGKTFFSEYGIVLISSHISLELVSCKYKG